MIRALKHLLHMTEFGICVFKYLMIYSMFIDCSQNRNYCLSAALVINVQSLLRKSLTRKISNIALVKVLHSLFFHSKMCSDYCYFTGTFELLRAE